MVEVDKYMPKDFTGEDSVTVSPNDFPSGELEMTRIDEVEIKSGFSAGQVKLVIEAKDGEGKLYSYWPNKTSIKTLADAYGRNTDSWNGKKFKLEVDTVRVRGQKMKALFALAEGT